MFTANTHETATRIWTSSHPPKDVAVQVRDALKARGAQVRSASDVVEATFGSRWMMASAA